MLSSDGDGIQINRISAKEMKYLLAEFNQQEDSRDYREIARLLTKLKFFAKFPLKIRMELIQSAELLRYRRGEIIISQGDTANHMFVILKGSVVIEKQAKDFGDTIAVVGSLYDGD